MELTVLEPVLEPVLVRGHLQPHHARGQWMLGVRRRAQLWTNQYSVEPAGLKLKLHRMTEQ
jgi:hypothetical protein